MDGLPPRGIKRFPGGILAQLCGNLLSHLILNIYRLIIFDSPDPVSMSLASLLT